jgi:predicted RNA-binding protein with TRAM domain
VVEVEMEDIGDQGDGIAHVGLGYVVIVPETEMGGRVSVRISEAKENMALADVVERHDPR